MGSGKSTVARALAERLDTFYVDTDTLIESRTGKSIAQIFKEEGEAHFRSLEKNAVTWIKGHLRGAIIATGGGLPIHCPEIKECGTIAYLKMPFEKIEQRLQGKEGDSRPLLVKDDTKRLYESRSVVYETLADTVLCADGTLEEVCDSLTTLPPISY